MSTSSLYVIPEALAKCLDGAHLVEPEEIVQALPSTPKATVRR